MTPRDVVDNSYDVGLCVVLDDDAGHDVYQEPHLHKEFIARNKANWDACRFTTSNDARGSSGRTRVSCDACVAHTRRTDTDVIPSARI